VVVQRRREEVSQRAGPLLVTEVLDTQAQFQAARLLTVVAAAAAATIARVIPLVVPGGVAAAGRAERQTVQAERLALVIPAVVEGVRDITGRAGVAALESLSSVGRVLSLVLILRLPTILPNSQTLQDRC